MKTKVFSILIIDSNQRILDAMALALARKGHQIMFALSLEMAMEFMNDVRLDLIIIGTRGIENQLKIVGKLKETMPKFPILTIMWNEFKQEEYVKLLQTGVSGFINTPFSAEEVEDAMKKAMKQLLV